MEEDDPVTRQRALMALKKALALDPKYRLTLGDLQWAQGFWTGPSPCGRRIDVLKKVLRNSRVATDCVIGNRNGLYLLSPG
jgi:hypothetical protein